MKILLNISLMIVITAFNSVAASEIGYINVERQVDRKGKNYIYEFMKKIPEGTSISINPNYVLLFCDLNQQVFSYENSFSGYSSVCTYKKKKRLVIK